MPHTQREHYHTPDRSQFNVDDLDPILAVIMAISDVVLRVGLTTVSDEEDKMTHTQRTLPTTTHQMNLNLL